MPTCHNLGKSKVCDDHMPIFVKKNIFWLQISVSNVDVVEVGKSGDNFCREEFDCTGVEPGEMHVQS